MNENHQTETESHRIERYEDEIELIDILNVIWKWKNLILLGTVFCGVLAAIISLNLEKIYCIDMVLRPGVLSIEKEGKNVYIDSPQNIKALIESGMFDNDILDYLKSNNADNIPQKLRFKVTIPKESDTIKVQYETSDIKQGIDLQIHLGKLLIENYRKLVTYFKNEYDMKIELENNNISKLTNKISNKKNDIFSIKADSKNKLNQKDNNIAVLIAEKIARKNQIKNLNQRISEIEAETGRTIKNTDLLIEERNKFLSSTKNDDNILSSLIYSTTVQQNIAYLNSLRSTINNVSHQTFQERLGIEKTVNVIKDLENEKENLIKQTEYKVEKIKSEIEDFEGGKKYILVEIKNLQFKKDNIQNIQFLQPATCSSFPIKPKRMLNVALALVAGLFLMLFLAFFLEYLSKHKSKMDQ
jgi:LPS O-antigen subunit length determinant protein (WzzB/FepE family)